MSMLQLLPEHDNQIHNRRPNRSELMDVEHKLYMGSELTEDDRQVILRLIEKAPYKRVQKAPKESYELENDRLKKQITNLREDVRQLSTRYAEVRDQNENRFLVWNRIGRAFEAFFTTIRRG